ncbi:MAG: 16S rRNA (uracil(1498)-N(3))-methyltransferase [Bacillota bacterium]|nr:16S rRNA (uracil(1498)-N(3))-methyltransferase [Bacillota bacterium]
MPFFFKEDEKLSTGKKIALIDDDINHVYRVLRLKCGEAVTVADGRGKAFSGEVTVSRPDKVEIILRSPLNIAKPSLQLNLLQSLPKSGKFDLIVRQAVELGIHGIVPVIMERSIPSRNSRQEEKRIKRWRNIARSAAAQCRRPDLPSIEMPRHFTSIVPQVAQFRTIVPWEKEKSLALADALQRPLSGGQNVLLFIGPEGGFSDAEMKVLHQAGAETVYLGPRILRTETAAIASMVMIQTAWGDLSEKGFSI